MTLNEITKLRPEFKLGNGITMVDWFEVRTGVGHCCISSGLRHADGVTRSPYYYEHCVGGKNARKECLKEFNTWYGNLPANI